MNILFLTVLDFNDIYENGIYTDLLREFANHNHKLYIISPTEKRKNSPTKLIDNEDIKILKLQIGNMQKTSILEKGISLLTLETKFRFSINKFFNEVKFDLIIYSTPPITLQKTVEYVKNRDKAKTYLLLKDIFPQNAVDLGMLSKSGVKKMLYNFFRKKEEKLYEISDYIGCMSKANVDYIVNNNAYLSEKKIEVCPNSITPLEIYIHEENKNKIRDKYNIPKNKVVFIYGGNLGKPQGIDFLIECIKRNEENSSAFILIVGSGTEYNKLNSFINKIKPNNTKLINQLPKNDYELLANSCDVGLIFLDKRFTIPNFPSRLLSYMQASMPVIAATDINTDIKETIETGEFGFWCKSEDVNNFNRFVNILCDKELRLEMGLNSRTYLESNFTSRHSYEIIMKHFNK